MLSKISAHRKLLDLFVEEMYSQCFSKSFYKGSKTYGVLASPFRIENWDFLSFITIFVNFC